MANLSNINNKFLVTTGGNVLIGQTSAVGSSIFQVTGNATFAGEVKLQSSNAFTTLRTGNDYGWSIYANSSNFLTFGSGATANTKGTTWLTIQDNNGNATFAGSVGVGGSPTTNYPLTLRSKVGDYTKILDWGTDVGGSWGTMQISMSPPYATELRSGAWNFVQGNVGIGVTPAAHYGGFDVLDIGNSLSLISNNTSTNTTMLTNNAYLNSGATAWVRKVADEATMYEQVSGQHRFSNAGSAAAGVAITWSERMRIDSSGNVGINNTNPSAFNILGGKNVVIGDGTQTNNLTLFSATTGGGVGYGHIAFADSNTSGSSAQYAGLIQYYHGNDSMQFYTNATPRMTILDSGNVGIGTTTPDTLLHIYNSSSAWGAYSTITLGTDTEGLNQAQLKYYRGASSSTESFQLSVRGTTALTALYNGNVGIGTTSPAGALHVVGRVNTTRIVSSNLILGNIRSNLSTTSYLLLVDLNVAAGFSLAGKLNAASYTKWNVSDIYVRKNYSSTSGVASITGISKSGSNLSIVDISHASGRFIAIKLTGDPEIDVMWTGYRLDALFGSDGIVTTLTSGVTENSVYASY